jgi:hypothetical protein
VDVDEELDDDDDVDVLLDVLLDADATLELNVALDVEGSIYITTVTHYMTAQRRAAGFTTSSADVAVPTTVLSWATSAVSRALTRRAAAKSRQR